MIQTLLRFLARILDLYTAAAAVWMLRWLTRGDGGNGWLAMLNAWTFWLLLANLPAGILSIGRRSRRLGLGWLAGIAAILAWRYGWTIPALRRFAGSVGAGPAPLTHADLAAPEATARTLRLLSANLLKHNEDLSNFLTQVRQNVPDMVLVQELTPALATQLERELARIYPHRYWFSYQPTNMGFGVASRVPFAVTGLWQRPGIEPFALRVTVPVGASARTVSPLDGGPGAVDLCTVDLCTVDIYNVQFISPTNEIRRLGPTAILHMREGQVRRLLEEVDRRGRPTILMGDWNTTEGTDIYQETASQLTDAWRVAGNGPGLTWPRTLQPFFDLAGPPLLRLDYCFVTSDVIPTAMRVIHDEVGSDHCPILVDVQIPAPALPADHTFSGRTSIHLQPS